MRKVVERVQAVRPVRGAGPTSRAGRRIGARRPAGRAASAGSHDVRTRARRDRSDAVRDAGGAGVDGRRGVPRAGRAPADRRAAASSAWSAPAVTSVLLWNRRRSGFGVIVADNFGLFVTFTLVIVGILTIMFSSPVLERDGMPAGEYYALVLFAIVGMMMMATANDLLVIFVALEILSLAVYVLTGIRRDNPAGTEAAFKYFLLGAFSSAFFLYGIAFTYGVTGITRLSAVGAYLSAQALSSNPMILIAMGSPAGRLRLQDLGGAVPHVDARRLRGRAGGGHRLHVHRRQGRGVCRVRARVPVGASSRSRPTGRRWSPRSRR